MNGTLIGNRATARVAPTIDDDFVMPPAAEYGSGDHYAPTGFTWGRSLLHETPAPQDLFATSPMMKATRQEFDWQRAEEAYTSFEAAISNRVLALKERRVSAYLGTSPCENVTPAVQAVASAAANFWHKMYSGHFWRHGLLLAVTALMLMLAGFDLMGLLVLYAR